LAFSAFWTSAWPSQAVFFGFFLRGSFFGGLLSGSFFGGFLGGFGAGLFGGFLGRDIISGFTTGLLNCVRTALRIMTIDFFCQECHP
jgi:hypothetical protein